MTSASDFIMKWLNPTTSSIVALLTSTFLRQNLLKDLAYSPVAGCSLGGSLSLYCDGCLRGEIPTLPAPSYQQARQPRVTKPSPPRAATPSPPVESPKAKRSGGKGGPHHGTGCSSNTSTLKCPNSTSTKKPSSSKGPTSNGQEMSPKVHGSHKCSCSPSVSTKSVRRKWKDVHMEGNHTLNSTLPVSSSAFDGLCSPTGSHSDGTEPLPPSITSTSLGLGGPRQW